ncbi:MAG: 3-mercaptopyruvate sulfurtransferase [Gemmatimonadetes bacterium]|nr:3-mercaptopyruvate sulfurtransferase [Gemmatimonadota bacterium]
MTQVHLPGAAVSVDWLANHLGSPGLVVLDGSWYLPSSGRDPAREFRAAHIPGARFFDVDACSDPEADLPHTVPHPERFAACAEALGVSNRSAVVVYDASGVNLSAPRVWWTFRYFGHERVAVLDGGLGAWQGAGHPLDTGEAVLTLEVPEPYVPTPRPELIRSAAQVLEAARGGGAQIVDMRPRGRFEGTAAEPRPGLRGGHVPGSRSLPYRDLVDEEGLAIGSDALAARLARAGIDSSRPLIGTCGSGTSACAFAWLMARDGREDVAIYDGSWSEWGGRDDLPVDTGPPDPA